MAQQLPIDSSSSPAPSSVHIVAHHTLQCADESSLAALDSPVMRLGPFDHLVPPVVPIAVVFVFRPPKGCSTELIPIARLQRVLSRLLDFYPMLTGRAEINKREHTAEIVRLGTGALLLEATCSATLDLFAPASGRADARLTMSDLPDGGNALMAPYTPTVEVLARDPMFTVQHTRFPCGSVTLGVRVPHMLCDAAGFFFLMQDMAKLYRATCVLDSNDGAVVVHLTHPPHIKSYLADVDSLTPEEKQAALQFKPTLYELAPTPEETAAAAAAAAPASADSTPAASSVAPSPAPPVVGRFLSFSAAELAALKSLASDPSSGGWISTFDALSAHLYHRVHVARKHLAQCSDDAASAPTTTVQTPAHALKEAAEAQSAAVEQVYVPTHDGSISTDFLTPVNWRGADRLNLPPRYFPNALFTVYFGLPPQMLADTAPLSAIARALHDSVRGLMSQQQGVDTLRWMSAQPDKRRIRQGFRYANGGFMLSQWSCFDLYDGIQFDADQHGALISPVLVQPPFTPISLMDGLGYILPTRPQQAGSSGGPSDSAAASSSPSASGAPSIGTPLDVALALSAPVWAALDRDPLFRPFREE